MKYDGDCCICGTLRQQKDQQRAKRVVNVWIYIYEIYEVHYNLWSAMLVRCT